VLATCIFILKQETITHEKQAETIFYVKNAVFWDVAPCRSCVNRRFGGTSPPLREQMAADCSNLLTLVPRSRIFLP
jgi:hypothetical protein